MSQKLKGIYDALDHGNYKNAVKLCSALLQKQPANSLCKALQAVALERCGRRDDALQLCGEAASGSGVDETVLNTCQVVYRRCRQGATILRMYDAACSREPENEDYAVALFFATIREGEFVKSQQVATKLYKKFNKPSYLHWIIVSILLQVEGGGSSKALDLAEMMLKKAPVSMEVLKTDKEHAPFNRQQLYLLQLHLTTLRRQHKYTEALEMLEAGQGFVRLPADILGLRLQLLSEAGQVEKATAEVHRAVLAGTADWATVREYIKLSFQCPTSTDALPQLQAELGGETVAVADHGARLRPRDGGAIPDVATVEDVERLGTDDRVWNALLVFRQQQQHGGADGGPLTRTALLAELELRRVAFQWNARALGEGREANWRAAVSPDDFGAFVAALESYLKRFSQRSSCYFELKPFLALLEQGDAAPLLALGAETCEASATLPRVRRAFRRPRDGASPKELLDDARGLLQRWAACQSQGGGKSQGIDELLALSVAALVDLDRKCCRGSLAQGGTYLVDAVAVADMGLAANPHAFQLKVALVLLYGALRIPGAMLQVYNKMDIKNIQHESLSYMVLDALGSCGCDDTLHELCQNVTQFHEDVDKDGGDAVSTAFQHGVLHRVPEYLESLECMGRSVVWGRAVVDEVLSDLGQLQTWEALPECLHRQSVLVSAIASRPSSHWILSNQDRSVLSSLHPLPLATPMGTSSSASSSCATRPSTLVQASPSAAVSSSALIWKAEGCTPLCQEEPSALEELLERPATAAAQLRLSASLLDALSALLRREGPCDEEHLDAALLAAREALQATGGQCSAEGGGIAAAVAGLAVGGGPWSPVPARFAALAAAGAVEACEAAQLVLRCASAKEPWEKAEAKLTSLAQTTKALVGFARGATSSEDAAGTERGVPPFALGGHGTPCCWALLHHCAPVLVPVALWCCTALPKAGSGKKAKEGQEALHAARVGLRNLLSAVQTALGELSEALTTAQGAGVEALLGAPAEDAEGFPGNLVVEDLAELTKHREQVRTLMLEAHKRHLQALRDAVGHRLALLKSRGAFKP